jgi:hypothetical protein
LIETTKGITCLARASTVRDCYAIFKVLATSKPEKFYDHLKEKWYAISLPGDLGIELSNKWNHHQIKEVSPKDFPLWVGSTYVSKEFEDLLKGEPCPS